MVSPIPMDPIGGGVKPPSRSVVFRFILQACERFDIRFQKSERDLAQAVRDADLDELIELAFYGMGAGISRPVLVAKCKTLGLE